MADTIVHYKPGADIPCMAGEDLKAGTFVYSTGFEGRNPIVNKATADGAAFGVVAHDATEGTYVTVYRGGVVTVAAEGNVNAGDPIAVAADGKAKAGAAGGIHVGVAADVSADNTVIVAL